MTKDFKPNGWFLPSPVLVIGTYNADGTPNAMNIGWGGQWSQNEIMIMMGNNHTTTENINRCGEFTVTFATTDTMVGADYVGIVSGKKENDKVANTGWSLRKANNVNAPVFENFPMTMECRIKERLNETKFGANIIAEILNIVCDVRYLAEDGKPDVEKMHLITCDPIHFGYLRLGTPIDYAFNAGKSIKNRCD